jgi:hypothetical protein
MAVHLSDKPVGAGREAGERSPPRLKCDLSASHLQPSSLDPGTHTKKPPSHAEVRQGG